MENVWLPNVQDLSRRVSPQGPSTGRSASSRTGSPDSTICAVRSPDGMDPFITKNIVFREILSDAMDVE